MKLKHENTQRVKDVMEKATHSFGLEYSTKIYRVLIKLPYQYVNELYSLVYRKVKSTKSSKTLTEYTFRKNRYNAEIFDFVRKYCEIELSYKECSDLLEYLKAGDYAWYYKS